MKKAATFITLMLIGLTAVAQNIPHAYSWRGLINEKWAVDIYLETLDNIIQGEIVYTKNGNTTPITLLGTVTNYDDGSSYYTFNEMAADGSMTGHIYGQVTKDGGFEGTWTAPSKIKDLGNGAFQYSDTKQYSLVMKPVIKSPVNKIDWTRTTDYCNGTYQYSFCENGDTGTLTLYEQEYEIMCRVSAMTAAPAFNEARVVPHGCDILNNKILCSLSENEAGEPGGCIFEIIPFKNFAVVRYVPEMWHCGFAMGTTIEGVYVKQPEVHQTITVGSTEEFIDAIGSNRTIILKKTALFNLSEVIDQYYSDGETPAPASEPFPNYLNVSLSEEFDGNQLNIHDVHNMRIVGEGNLPVKMMVRPRYSYVISFSQCSDITIENIDAGHTPGGYCSGGVFNFEGVDNVTIKNTIMYGCGTEGITAFNTNNLTCTESIIKECTYSIMTLTHCRNFTFTACDFFDNKEYSLINMNSNCSEMLFDSCSFYRNSGTLFSLENPITLKNCTVEHFENEMGSTQMIRYEK